MPSEAGEEFIDVPRPIGIFLESAYFILLALGFLASILTVCCLLWNVFGTRFLHVSRSSPTEPTSDMERYRDEGLCEEYVGLEFEDDTVEEYMRRPY